MLANSERWTELSALLKDARASRPDAEFIRVFLADALAQTGDLKGAHDLLDSLEDLPEEDEMVDKALLQAALAVGEIELAGRELLRLGPQAETNNLIQSALESLTLFIRNTAGGQKNAPVVRPRSFAPEELNAELEHRLTPEERKLLVNPLEITPELTAEARRLTVGITNAELRVFALFAEVARRGRGAGNGGQRTANEALKDSDDPEARLSCQEHAKLFVTLARVLGLEAWLVHVERCADGSPAYHDCAAVFLDGDLLLVDPTWRVLGIRHREFTVLDDVQAVSHQAMQAGPKPNPRRLRVGLKLHPDDRWTRLQFVRGMAHAGEFAAASEELRGVRSTGAETWDVHVAAAELEIARDEWKPALAELQRAVALSPSNAVIHARLALVYGRLRDLKESTAYMERAMELNPGEISNESQRESQYAIQMMNALSQAKSGAPGSEEALQRRAEAGELPAQMARAQACFEARPPRTDEGMRWLLKAAEQGDDQAQFNYARNLLVLRREDAAIEAVKWLNQSAAQGNDDAQYRLGLILYEGKLALRDHVTAGHWIYLAADQNHVEARHLLKELGMFLTAGELAEARKRADTFKPVKKSTAIRKE